MTPEADKALSKAKLKIMSADNTVFISNVMLSLNHIWDNSQPTAYTDGTVVGYNSDFFMASSPEHQAFYVFHETWHPAFLHILRGEGYDPEKYNIAADHVINLMAKEQGFSVPDWAYCDAQYRGMSTEQIYALLPDKPSKPHRMVDLRKPPDKEHIKDVLDDILVRASIQSRMGGDKPGTIPGELEFYIDKLINPEIPWHHHLRRFMNAFARDDYSLRRPNRRFMPQYILPGMFSEKIGEIVVGEDVSGSVTKFQHQHFVAETKSILKGLKPDKVTFIQWDTRITKVDDLKLPKDADRVRMKGGGGTNVNPLMQWAKDNKPVCLIIFTDGFFGRPHIDPRVPVIWVINGNPHFKAPFGKVITYNFNGPRKT